MAISLVVETPIVESPRVQQLRGLFDLSPQRSSRLCLTVNLTLDRPWNMGLITGPSGCGKSTVARHLWPRQSQYVASLRWSHDRAVVDAFPTTLPVKDIADLLTAVGFGSPPSWLLPFHVLSTGQQFRMTLARLLGEACAAAQPLPIVMDEFTSVVDRTVAQIGSAALARAVRRRGLQFVAVTCHDDVTEWLQPDWVYRPADDSLTWRLLQRRPPITLEVCRCHGTYWRLFAPHHYLSHDLAASAWCFLARWNDRPVAFSAWLPYVGSGRPARREHRTVTLPDFQGVGIGSSLSNLIASLWRGLGYRAVSTTTHPGFIESRRRSPFWLVRRNPSLARGRARRIADLRHATTRLTAGFEYVGPPLPEVQARRLLA